MVRLYDRAGLSFLCRLFIAHIILFCASPKAFALEAGPNDMYVRVIDVGQGLCCVVRTPGDRYMIYDAGIGSGVNVFNEICETIPPSSVVDLVILSHTDGDHLAAVPEIMQGFQVDTVWRPDRQPGDQTDAWEEAEDAIELSGCNDPGLDSGDVAPGLTIPLGNASITMVCGFTEPPAPWQLSNPGEIRNAGSIVVRLDFQGRSVLFCGDTVGRHTGQPNDACIAAELFMVTNSAQVPLRSDVIIAPHHGADNGSSTPFIAEVNPTYVVFSAGHHGTYRHPRASAALRYLSHGVPAERMLRTDLGDDDGPDEWDHGRIEGHRDLKGDDDVEIVIREDGTLLIAYQNPANPPIDGLHFGPLAESQMMDESPTAAPDVPTRALASDVEAVCAPTPTVYCGAQSSHACGKCYKSTRRLFRLRSCRDSRCR